jgi:hypothetical protein
MYGSIYLALFLSIFYISIFILIPVSYLFFSSFWFYSILLFVVYILYRFPIYFERFHRKNPRESINNITKS